MRKSILLLLTFSWLSNGFAQNKDLIIPGPNNVLSNGVIDGIVVKEDLPVRPRVEYEFVRESDLVWSKRLFSRIDKRERVNHPLFYPNDKFLENYTEYPPGSVDELMRNKDWVRSGERLSLWTIILQHLMSGDLTMFLVSDSLDFNFAKEDGYSLKYSLQKKGMVPYFSNPAYRSEVDKRIGTTTPGATWFFRYQGDDNFPMSTNAQYTKFEDWVDWYRTSDVNVGTSTQWAPGIEDVVLNQEKQLRKSWEAAMKLSATSGKEENLELPAKTYFLTSEMITAFNIKEDWYFDKERSLLDKRIISIAPVARFSVETTRPSSRGELVVQKFDGSLTNGKKNLLDFSNTLELEMFWLYFPELRNVLINYYVYNNQNDAPGMSFDDFFWKRLFSAQIYKATDQFDRDIEDYRYGVDALYEAQKIKETMRTWETDLWHY
jgi:hypothetical protein